MIKLAAAIVARNGGKMLTDAVADLEHIAGRANVAVIDNASTDRSTAKLKVAVLPQAKNVGYAAGANLALAWAEERGTDALLLLNQDARLDMPSAESMIELLAGDANLGAVFAKVVDHDKPYLLDGLFGRRNLRHKLTTDLGGGKTYVGLKRPFSVQHGHGAALLLRVRAARTIGGFDETLFAYHDEVDLCWRLAKANWGVMLHPQAVVRHIGPEGHPERMRAKNYLLARNSLLSARRNAGRFGVLRVTVWALAATLVYYGPTALAGDENSRALVLGWIDGLCGRDIRSDVLAVL